MAWYIDLMGGFLTNMIHYESDVLRNYSNKPQQWLKSPTSDNVKTFSDKILKYEKKAKIVRKIVIDNCLKGVIKECKKSVGPVEKLSYLRSLRENVWPCPQCDELGN